MSIWSMGRNVAEGYKCRRMEMGTAEPGPA
jgi:hypothetical protein